MDPQYHLNDPDAIPSPSLLVYRPILERNIHRALALAESDPLRLRPHCKTHKTREIAEIELGLGITKHKCSTLVEAAMLAEAGLTDILIAYPLVGPAIKSFLEIMARYPTCDFKVTADHSEPLHALSAALAARGFEASVLVDLDVGMHRTGIAPGETALSLYRILSELPGVRPGGIHAYDGQNHQRDPAERQRAAMACFEKVRSLKAAAEAGSLPVPSIVMGCTATFPIYARLEGVEASPGTCFLQDWGFQRAFPDLPFEPAAVLLSRVISVPLPGRVTLDLGYKAIASDQPGPRGTFLNLPKARIRDQNEEHWMLDVALDVPVAPGDEVYVVPTHVCPTFNLHKRVYVIDERGECIARWEVVARDRELAPAAVAEGV